MSTENSIARLEIKGNKFEVIVDPEKAVYYKLKKGPWSDKIVKFDQVFKDFKKGERASSELLQKFFGTKDVYKIAKRIVDEGEVQVPSNLRKKLIEDNRKRIINLISRITYDPQTNIPIPTLRIEQALEKVGVSIDPFKEPEEQVKPVLQELKKILPFKVKEKEVELQCSNEVFRQVYSILNQFGDVVNQSAKKDLITLRVRVPEVSCTKFVQKIANTYGEKVKVSLL
ncbi:MAG: ribosome assembly factor SBDS [Thermoproteota archaeon]|jgi:ribosome maturation protein SDO1